MPITEQTKQLDKEASQTGNLLPSSNDPELHAKLEVAFLEMRRASKRLTKMVENTPHHVDPRYIDKFNAAIRHYLKMLSICVYVPVRGGLESSPEKEKFDRFELHTRVLMNHTASFLRSSADLYANNTPEFVRTLKRLDRMLLDRYRKERQFLLPLHSLLNSQQRAAA